MKAVLFVVKGRPAVMVFCTHRFEAISPYRTVTVVTGMTTEFAGATVIHVCAGGVGGIGGGVTTAVAGSNAPMDGFAGRALPL